MKITILTDHQDSWFVPYGYKLLEALNALGGLDVTYIHDHSEVPENNDILFLLSCVKIVKKSTLDKSKSNIVVHASDLPAGKGFSPLQWQIREGKSAVTLTLFEANEAVDDGPYYFKHSLELSDIELLPESRDRMAQEIVQMCIKYVAQFPDCEPHQQRGTESFYGRLTDKDDELDINKPLSEQMNLIRGADFDKFPLHFSYKGKKFTVKVRHDEKS